MSMQSYVYVAFLRGINVGGHKKIRMEELRRSLSVLDLEKINTYIQSGNIVFVSTEADASQLQFQIEQKIAGDFGFEVKVLLRERASVEQIMSVNPFLNKEPQDIS